MHITKIFRLKKKIIPMKNWSKFFKDIADSLKNENFDLFCHLMPIDVCTIYDGKSSTGYFIID